MRKKLRNLFAILLLACLWAIPRATIADDPPPPPPPAGGHGSMGNQGGPLNAPINEGAWIYLAFVIALSAREFTQVKMKKRLPR